LKYKIAFRKLTLLIIILLLTVGCGETPAGEKPVATVSILPQQYWVQRLAGDFLEVQVMVPPGTDSHTYEPTPADIKKLARSDLYFRIGYIDFEKSWMQRFTAINQRMRVVNLPGALPLIASSSHEGEDGGVDPHIWLSPRVVNLILADIASELEQHYPDHREQIRANLRAFLQEVDSLDQRMNEMLKGIAGDTVLIYHPALAYMARDYGFVQVSIEEEGKNPSPAHLKEVVDIARRNAIRNILVQQQIDPGFASGIAREVGGEVILIDPYSPDWMNNMNDIAHALLKIHQR
jgi:zinc transport system substrate-binding protein